MVFGIALISCHTTKTSSGNIVVEKNNAAYLNGTWQLQMLFASDNNWAQVPFININLKDKTFSGNGSCNTISGKFTIDVNYLGFDKNITSTKMACPNNYEKSFLSALLKINRYTLNKDELELGQGDIVLMKFKRN
ncbi:MAG: hypothetical protein JWO92_1028 [Chitinophagaceae bacterium]|nr:hypothetical protein [Chitinophagaceae bacterium]